MPQSLRSILGNSNRVRKPSRTAPTQSQKQSASSPSPRKKTRRLRSSEDPDVFEDKLEDIGLVKLLTEELTLRDVVQAIRFIRTRMFTPVPDKGFNSTRTAELINYRAFMTAIVTMGHLHAILNSPTKVERELIELQREGVVRKVRIERRGGQGEALIESASLFEMIQNATLSTKTKENFTTFLKENPTAQALPDTSLIDAEIDELVRTGFLTSSMPYAPGSTLHIRPEDRKTLTSISHISRHASGSLSAVGGRNAIHLAGGGSGAHPTLIHSSSFSASELKLAIPGHGRYLKLATASVDWLRDALGKTKWGECSESWLREKFEGGGFYGPKWKGFWGVEWDWVIGEAVGLGAVEIFETGSVGRGVRALGG